MRVHRTSTARANKTGLAITAALGAALIVGGVAGGTGTPAAHGATVDGGDRAGTPVSLTATTDGDNAMVSDDLQGFSVESADLAHGFLTRERMAGRLRTLGQAGVVRVGGYSMDLVWPAFGAWAGAPAPSEAIGGTVDQSDLDKLKGLVDASGWKVSLGLPLKKTIDPAKIKNPTKDPSPAVTLDQVVAEVVAAHRTLGDKLVGVEIGNEYDNVTTLTAAEMWTEMKRYQSAIKAALPHADIKVIGPSANTATTNTRLEDFMTAVQHDTTTNPERVLHEISSHLYPGSHCGSSNTSIASLLGATVYTRTRDKLDGIMDIGAGLHNRFPMTINESNSASCSGQPNVSNAYAMSLWSLDYLMETAQSGIRRLQFHTSTAAICGDFQPRDSANYPTSYRYYGAFCADDQAALDANLLSPMPLYYGLWAFRQVPQGRFVDLNLPDESLGHVRAYGVQASGGTMTLVVVNIQDPASTDSTTDDVSVTLPASYRSGRALTLESADTAGLGSLDTSAITLGGQQVTPDGAPTGPLHTTPVGVDHRSTTVSVQPGTAQIVTYSAHR